MTHLQATYKLHPLDLLMFSDTRASVQFLWNNNRWQYVFFESMTPPGGWTLSEEPTHCIFLSIPQISVKITAAGAPDSTQIRVLWIHCEGQTYLGHRRRSKAGREKKHTLFHLWDSKGPCDEILKVISHVHIISCLFHNDAATITDC